MPRLSCVLLRHEGIDKPHFDWMVEDPKGERRVGLLLTWRIAYPARFWRHVGAFPAIRIGDHRRAYLDFEGELSRGRGRVKRVDEGVCAVRRWAARGGVLDLHLHGFRGTVSMREAHQGFWVVEVVSWPKTSRASSSGEVVRSHSKRI